MMLVALGCIFSNINMTSLLVRLTSSTYLTNGTYKVHLAMYGESKTSIHIPNHKLLYDLLLAIMVRSI